LKGKKKAIKRLRTCWSVFLKWHEKPEVMVSGNSLRQFETDREESAEPDQSQPRSLRRTTRIPSRCAFFPWNLPRSWRRTHFVLQHLRSSPQFLTQQRGSCNMAFWQSFDCVEKEIRERTSQQGGETYTRQR
jgi:hypothetical protein